MATADDTPLPPDSLMGPANPTLSFAPTVQPTYEQPVWRLCQCWCCLPYTSSFGCHHTSPSHCPASAIQPFVLPLPPLLPLQSSLLPLWPPIPRRNAATDTNAHTLILSQTVQPCYCNVQAVHCMHTQHWCHHWGPCASPGTC